VIVVCVSAIMMISVSSLMSYNISQRNMVTRREVAMREMTAAERAVDSMVSRILYNGRYRPDGLDGSYANFHTAVKAIDVPTDLLDGFDIQDSGVLSLSGDTPSFGVDNDPTSEWFGQNILSMRYQAFAQVKEVGGNADRLTHPGIRLARTVQVDLVPIYQYAIFYENTLELDAGQRIDVVGKVHSNGDFYLTTSSEAWYHKQISVANRFYAGIYSPSNGRGTTGSTNINVTTNGNGTFDRVQGTTQSSSQWLDSRYENWAGEAIDRFNGFLKDRTHGVQKVALPLPTEADPRTIIERANVNDSSAIASQKFENFASIRVYGDPQTSSSIYAVDANGNPIPTTYTAPNGSTKSWVSTDHIYNGREEKEVYLIDVNAGNLAEAASVGAIDLGNAVVYVSPTQPSSSTRQAAARLVNAKIVPTDAYDSFSFVSNAPVYTKGDVNAPSSASDRAMVLIAGDAINVLSNNFKESEYRNNPGGKKDGPKKGGKPTTTNAIFMGGNTPSDYIDENGNQPYLGRYSGGAENYFRYIESWGSSNPHTFNGTLMNLWRSEIANKSWDKNPAMGQQSSGYYGPPRRIWAWDVTFQSKFPPPHWPTFWIFNTVDWQIMTPEVI
jgi:hypothetical protein